MRLPGVLLSAIAVAAVLLGSAGAANAAATIERTVGPYNVSFGYTDPQAYMEELATVRVVVTDAATGAPVVGLENQIEAMGQIRVLDITKDFLLTFLSFNDRPGVYEAVFVPPKPGDYSYRLVGDINGTEIDESYVSGEGGLTPIIVRTEIEYGERGSWIATVSLAGYVVGLAALLGFMLWRRMARRRASPA